MGDKGGKSAARQPEGCPSEAGGLFGPESALGFEHPSGTNARRPCYSPINISEETELIAFYDELSFLAGCIHNVLVIDGDMNA